MSSQFPVLGSESKPMIADCVENSETENQDLSGI